MNSLQTFKHVHKLGTYQPQEIEDAWEDADWELLGALEPYFVPLGRALSTSTCGFQVGPKKLKLISWWYLKGPDILLWFPIFDTTNVTHLVLQVLWLIIIFPQCLLAALRLSWFSQSTAMGYVRWSFFITFPIKIASNISHMLQGAGILTNMCHKNHPNEYKNGA